MTYRNVLLKIAALAAGSAVPLVVISSPATAQSAGEVKEFSSRAGAILEAAYPADGPGAAVIVMRRGQVIYAAGRGFADMETGRPITVDTPFRLGSIVKQFTAATVLKLVTEGKISLDDPVSRFFPDWPEPGAGATVRQLLNHSSGIQDFSKIPGWIAKNRHRPWTTAELLAVSRALPAKAQPGHAWEYNNGGYVMLGAIIEKATGKAWHEVLSERITRPLGLPTITYSVPEAAIPSAASGYTEVKGRQQLVQLSHMSIAHAAGGLQGSVNDMARWARALHHGGVVSPVLYQEMVRPARMADGSTEPYGFGLRLRQIRGRAALVHGGAGGGLDTDSIYIPSEDIFVAVFANSDEPATDPASLTRRLAALALGQPIPTFKPAKVDIAAIEPLFGIYKADTGPLLRFFRRDGKLMMGQGDMEREAIAAGEDRFFFADDDLTWLKFVRHSAGAHIIEVSRVDHAQPQRAVRAGPVPPPLEVAAAILESYVGTYQTETLAVTISIGQNGRLTITPTGQPPLRMRPVSNTEFRMDGTPMRLVFHPEGGRVNRFTLYRGARELHGQRVTP